MNGPVASEKVWVLHGLSEAIFTGNEIDGLEGKRDVDLVRDVVKPREKASLPAGDAPTLVLVTDGEVEIRVPAEEDAVTLKSGEAAEFEGKIDVTARDDGAASFVAAVIGPDIGDGAQTNDQATVTVEPSSTEPDAEPTDVSVLDADGGGLDDDQEANLGTDPSDPDSDDDGLGDGAEVNEYQSNPLSDDTDQDGLGDGAEVNQYGSSPTSLDTDGDMLPDYNEVMQHGTDPANPDTHGDGVSDGDEIVGGMDPADPTSTP